ncbi:MAG: single-stranded-DNA-specific exonuclease RecJ [Dehalococcoidia bacterium]|nr:single-stranded-DNA-specific exonuclease RecJ [Dehalococcoidia bacterium]
MTRQKWQVCPTLPMEEIGRRLNSVSLSSQGKSVINPLLVQLLHNRGVEDPAEFEIFLTADERLLHDPFLLPDIEKAVTRILRALLGDELIAIYGDFDADGITATALMVEGISRLGGRVVQYIPHRQDEGHGLNSPALKALRDDGVSLVITVDCGVSGGPEIMQGRELGLDIIITDHHVTPGVPAGAVAVIDPRRPDSIYPFPDLAGVGVAYKLLEALFHKTGRHGVTEFLDLVALGTITDMVPLKGENRYLVRRGLEVLNSTARIGLQELIAIAGLEAGRLDEESIAFALGPRLNASGRMAHAVASYDLLVTSSREEARRLASELEYNNCERQRCTVEVLGRAKEILLAEGCEQPLLMVGDQDFPLGIIGVVAGRISDFFYRPAIVLQLDGDSAKGSCRSIPEFDIFSALAECGELLTRFGGHPQAAGFVVSKDNLEELNRRLLHIACRQLSGVDLRPVIRIDREIPLAGLDGDTFRTIARLAPFGKGNQVPTFLSRRVELVESRKMGVNGDHLKLKLRDGRLVWDAVAFDLGDRELCRYLDLVYTLAVESWSGREFLRLNVEDILPSN